MTSSSPARPIRVRFIGPAGGFNSMAAHGHRVSNGINALDDVNVRSDVIELPRDTFDSRFPLLSGKRKAWLPLVEDVDVLIVVKSSALDRFTSTAGAFKALCREKGVIIVSSPADGAGANAGDTRDRFSEEIADYVFTGSHAQYDYLCARRDPETVFDFGVATRPQAAAVIPIRDKVQTVIWENPIHYDPNFVTTKFGMSKEEYAAFEQEIRGFCEKRGASLNAFGFWRDGQDDADWQNTLLNADIAIECKALNGRYSEYQLQKPPTKLQNYLALGLPVVCDPVPSYREIGRAAKVMFAESMEEWLSCLECLFESRELRAEMSAAARAAVAPYGIEAVARHHVASFEKMLKHSG